MINASYEKLWQVSNEEEDEDDIDERSCKARFLNKLEENEKDNIRKLVEVCDSAIRQHDKEQRMQMENARFCVQNHQGREAVKRALFE